MNEEQEFLSWEECREQIITKCTFLNIDNKWKASPNSMRILQSPKQKLLLDSLIHMTYFLPEDSKNIERMYYLLYNIKEFLNKKCPECGKNVKFYSLANGYRKSCGNKLCKNSVVFKSIQEFYIKNYGCNFIFQTPNFSKKTKQIKKERYGDENYNNHEQAEQTCVEKYGVDNPFKSKEIMEKVCQERFERTGYVYAPQNPEVKEKIKITYFQKTGYDHPMKNPEVQEKMKQDYFEKTGYSHWMYNPEVLEKRENACFIKTGYYSPLQNPEIIEKRKISYFEKTGYMYSLQNPESREKGKINYLNKTGYDCPSHNPEVREKAKNTCIKNTGFAYSFCDPKIRNKAFEKFIEKGIINYSKVSQELFDAIYEKLSEELKSECYYATCKTEGHQKEFGKNDTYNITYYLYDFTITSIKFIIEFDGNYWHSKPGSKERDEQKQKFIEDLGFKMIRIDEADYYQNKQKVIDYCINEINKRYIAQTNNILIYSNRQL